MQRIPLHGKHGAGLFALVDAEDCEFVSRYRWSVSNGYAVTYVGKRTLPMHRAIMRPPSGMEVDHINGNKLDNRRANLRICTHAENGKNRKPQRGGASRFKGVVWHRQKRKWQAQIYVDGAYRYLGLFASETRAAQAYNAAASDLHGEFARLNPLS